MIFNHRQEADEDAKVIMRDRFIKEESVIRPTSVPWARKKQKEKQE